MPARLEAMERHERRKTGPLGRRINKALAPLTYRLARWIVRRRARKTYLALSTWPLLVVAALMLWSFHGAKPNTNYWLYWTNRWLQLALVLLTWAFAFWRKWERWERLR